MKHTELAILSIGLLVAFSLHTSEARSVNLAPPQCHPSIISSMPPEVKKVCKALSTLYEISDTMENYLDDKGKLIFAWKSLMLGFQDFMSKKKYSLSKPELQSTYLLEDNFSRA